MTDHRQLPVRVDVEWKHAEQHAFLNAIYELDKNSTELTKPNLYHCGFATFRPSRKSDYE